MVTTFPATRTSDGTLYAGWNVNQLHGDAGVGHTTLAEDGTGSIIQLIADSVDRIHVFYSDGGDIMHSVSTDRTATWSSPTMIDASPDGGSLGMWSIRVDTNGGVHVLLGHSGLFNNTSELWYRQWQADTGWQPLIGVFDGGESRASLPADMDIVEDQPAIVWYSDSGHLTMARQSARGVFGSPIQLGGPEEEVIDISTTASNGGLSVTWLVVDGRISHQMVE
jgi:hypothetical protein